MYELTTSGFSIHYSDRYADDDFEYRLVTMFTIKFYRARVLRSPLQTCYPAQADA